MRDKVGIVTMVGYDNYGNLLQNFAVQTLLKELGYDAYTLNNETNDESTLGEHKTSNVYKLAPRYVIRYIKTQMKNLLGCKNDRDLTLKGILMGIRQRTKYVQAKVKRLKAFQIFREEYLPYDESCITSVEFNTFREKEYVAFVCGSDVVWHPSYHGDKKNDFLQFAPKYKRIALSPSFGVSELPLNRRKDYCEWLKGIQYLSVREDAGAKIIQELTGRDAEILSDPTIGVDSSVWRKLETPPSVCPEKDYVLCYFLGNMTSEYDKWIKKYAQKEKLEIIEMADIQNLEQYSADPKEFLWFVEHAKVVFSDSFHGIVFSILFHVPFVAFQRVEDGASLFSRVSSLLRLTALEQRVYPQVALSDVQEINFSNTDQIVKIEREKIQQYLRSALNIIKQNGECRHVEEEIQIKSRDM